MQQPLVFTLGDRVKVIKADGSAILGLELDEQGVITHCKLHSNGSVTYGFNDLVWYPQDCFELAAPADAESIAEAAACIFAPTRVLMPSERVDIYLDELDEDPVDAVAEADYEAEWRHYEAD